MVHELEVPLPNASLQINRDEAFGEEIVTGAIAAVHIQRRCFDREIHEAGFGIDSDLSPHSGITGPFPRSVFPGFITELAGIRNGIESPDLLPCTHVESADETF